MRQFQTESLPDGALGDGTNGSAATIYRASLIARVGKFNAGSPPDRHNAVHLDSENRGMTPLEIETLDNDAMNGRVAGLVSRYWTARPARSRWGPKVARCGRTCGMGCP